MGLMKRRVQAALRRLESITNSPLTSNKPVAGTGISATPTLKFRLASALLTELQVARRYLYSSWTKLVLMDVIPLPAVRKLVTSHVVVDPE